MYGVAFDMFIAKLERSSSYIYRDTGAHFGGGGAAALGKLVNFYGRFCTNIFDSTTLKSYFNKK